MRRHRRAPRAGHAVTLPARLDALESLWREHDGYQWHTQELVLDGIEDVCALFREGDAQRAREQLAHLERIAQIELQLAQYRDRIDQMRAQREHESERDAEDRADDSARDNA